MNTAVKFDKNFKILEIDIFLPLFVKFILETEKDRAIPLTYYWKPSTQSIQQQKNTTKYDEN